MSESDEDVDYEPSDDDQVRAPGRGAAGTRSSGPVTGRKERWEDAKKRTQDATLDGRDGSLAGVAEALLEADKRKRLMKDTTPLQRGIIRHIVLVIDCSIAMLEKDFRPSRYQLSFRYAAEFVREFFEQNPISQMAIIGMRDGIAESISDMGGNPTEHVTRLEVAAKRDPQGSPSLQNALRMAQATLFHSPSHGTREVVIVYGALMSSDPGDIHATIKDLVKDKVRCYVVGLAAQLAICQELCATTNGTSKDDASVYGVAQHEYHFRDLLMAHTTPPVQRAREEKNPPSLLPMGFPSRMYEEQPSFCACHTNETRSGYLCTRCNTKVCSLPAQCPACDLQLIQSTHLARSYHHLFPLSNYVEVSWAEARRAQSVECAACLSAFPEVPSVEELKRLEAEGKRNRRVGASESHRYKCMACGSHFCIDCDVYAHEVLHNCAGCLANPVEA